MEKIMTRILAISARKGGGKTTATNFIFGLEMLAIDNPKLIDQFSINKEGRLLVPSQYDSGIEMGIFDPITPNPNTIDFLNTNIWPYIKQYNFADSLKQDVCINILGLTWDQCYGTDEQKNTLTNLLWEDMPGVVVETNEKKVKAAKSFGLIVRDAGGNMSAREVMQFVGTDIFRKMYGQVWVDSCINRINAEGSQIALIGDCRFPNEVEGIQKAGGKVLRFTRNPYPEDTHSSELALEKDVFDWDRFDGVLDNANMNIQEQNKALYELLMSWCWAEDEVDTDSLVYGEKE
jgi:hypothetical protein